jgi:hypothetical protein
MKLPGFSRGYHKDLEGYTLVFEFDEEDGSTSSGVEAA